MPNTCSVLSTSVSTKSWFSIKDEFIVLFQWRTTLWFSRFQVRTMNEQTCCIDIDGVLNHYPQAWLRFLATRGWHFSNQDAAKTRLTYKDYTDLKYTYRQSPEKRFQSPRVGAAEFTAKLTKRGYQVILKTSRPIHEHPHLVGWTHDWLKDHNFTFKETIFTRYHPTHPLSQYPNLTFIVDDNPDIIAPFKKLGVQALLFDGNFDKILDALE